MQLSRFQTIVAMNTRNATVQGYVSFPGLADAYERSLRTLCDELDTIHGVNATPSNGCFIAPCMLGDAEVMVEFALEPEEIQTRDDPGYPEQVEPVKMLINGSWVDCTVTEEVIAAWTQRGHEWLQEQRDNAAVERY